MLIGTTSNCSNARNFITGFGNIYEHYKQFLDIEFIPWGRTTVSETGELSCQFGPADCWANRVQRCVISMLNGDQDRIMKYMRCEFGSTLPSFSGSYQCVSEVGLRLVEVDYCVTTTGDALEPPAHAASIEPVRIINFIPFIIFNGVIDQQISTQGRLRLESVLCFALANDPTTGITQCRI
ncbi:unnamed protein product [Leptidea sinapis]|uniref:Uncharacterized protein n=2 Tax=Leptidea sinapis TaxID=189913 RepID=A0A5E4PXR4_9NEOP|nr:unnamed protein product [Leptidea sinapis]